MALLHQGSIFALGKPGEVLKPDVVAAAFGASVHVSEHPVHKTPVVLPIGKHGLDGGADRSSVARDEVK